MINKERLVPEKTIAVVPHNKNENMWKEIIMPLTGEVKRDWFLPAFYYCLPLTIGNQYGFAVKSIRSFTVSWNGGDTPAIINIVDESDDRYQSIENVFGSGIVTIQNRFTLRTPPGINLMTIQPPNFFNPYMASLTGVIESDNLSRDFTFNIKMTAPGTVTINKGDVIAAFIPIPRYFVDSFTIKAAEEIFDQSTIQDEIDEFNRLVYLRRTSDSNKKYGAGRLYFHGLDSNGNKFSDHQGGKID